MESPLASLEDDAGRQHDGSGEEGGERHRGGARSPAPFGRGRSEGFVSGHRVVHGLEPERETGQRVQTRLELRIAQGLHTDLEIDVLPRLVAE